MKQSFRLRPGFGILTRGVPPLARVQTPGYGDCTRFGVRLGFGISTQGASFVGTPGCGVWTRFGVRLDLEWLPEICRKSAKIIRKSMYSLRKHQEKFGYDVNTIR